MEHGMSAGARRTVCIFLPVSLYLHMAYEYVMALAHKIPVGP